MDGRIIDACSLINLFASGREAEILEACGGEYFVSEHVSSEALAIRGPDPADSSKLISRPIDLASATSEAWLRACRFESGEETDAFVEFAQHLDDGEASCLAIAKLRGWTVVTDDRKAIRICSEHGIPVVTTPELLKVWSKSHSIDKSTLAEAIERVETFASFRPHKSSENFEWWMSAGK